PRPFRRAAGPASCTAVGAVEGVSRRAAMSRKLMFGGGILAGLGLMSLLDRDYGKRRRAILRDKLARGWNELGDGAGTTWRDLRNRARGLVAEMRSIADDKPVPDAVLVERVRA